MEMAVDRELSLSGPFADGALLVDHVTFHETLSEPFHLELDLLSPSPDLDISALVGEPLTLGIDLEAGLTRYLHGYVTRMALIGTFDKHARYHGTLRPWFFLMSSRENSRVFQNKSVPEIAKDLFREHGFSDFDDLLADDYPARDFVVQYQESDFAFVSRLLEKAGIYYYFKHQQDRHTMILADSASAHKTTVGYEEIGFHPDGSPTPDADECFNSWELVHQWRSGAYAGSDFDFEKPRANLFNKRQAEVRHKRGDLEVFDYPSGHLVAKEGEGYVRARLESLQSDVELVHGSGDVRGLGAGNLFSLTDHPTQDQNKQYLIVSAAVDATNNAHDTGTKAEPSQFHFSFSAVDGKVPFRPVLSTKRPRVQGPQTAIVVGKSGEEIWTDKYGRVKVQFHWDREGKSDEDSSCWVRVAQVWAGAAWGAMHVPRIGQEVIVDFLEGDPDRPIITGRVYNADNMPPYGLPANQTQSGIKSRSTKGGGPSNFNELRFEDKKGAEEVYAQAEKDLDVLVKNDEHRSVGHDRGTEIKHDETVTVGHNRTEQVTGDESVTIGRSRTETVGSHESVTVGATRSLTVALSDSNTVGGAHDLTVGASDSTSVGGTQSISVGGSQSVSVGGSQSVDIAGGQSISVAKDQSVSVAGKRSLDITKDDTVSVAGKRTVNISKDDILEVAKKLSINVADEISITTGDATISLKKNGDITIKGKNISIDGSGKVNVKASGDIILKGSKIAQN
jgi:type VI secretion system secreted protein VgrG